MNARMHARATLLAPTDAVGAAQTRAVVSAAPDFEQVYAQHVGFVLRVLRGMGLPAPQAEDAAQDVFMVVHRRLPEFDGRHALRTWLFEIAYRVAQEHRRKLRRAPVQDELEERSAQGRDPSEQAEDLEQLRLLGELLDGLDDDKRIMLVLSELEGLTAPEIASLTGLPLNTVYTRIRRARLQLDRALQARRKRKS